MIITRIYHFSERIKIEKFENLTDKLHNTTKYVIHIRNLKQALKSS